MNAKYLRLRATATKLIKANGFTTQMKRVIPGVKDPVAGNMGTTTEETQNITLVVLPPGGDPFSTKTDQYRGENGSLDLSRVKNVIISADNLTWEPKPLQRILYRGEWWIYEQATGLDPDGETDIMFKGFIRRA